MSRACLALARLSGAGRHVSTVLVFVSICLASSLWLQGPALWAREQIKQPLERGAAIPDSQRDPSCLAIATEASQENEDDDSSSSYALSAGEVGEPLLPRSAQSGQVAGGSPLLGLRGMHRCSVLTFAPKTGPPSSRA